MSFLLPLVHQCQQQPPTYCDWVFVALQSAPLSRRQVAAAPKPSSSLRVRSCSTFRAQPIRVPSQGVSPSKRRAAAAIVAARSPFHQPRPIFSTLMRQRGHQLRLVLANPRPLAPDATTITGLSPSIPPVTGHNGHNASSYPRARRQCWLYIVRDQETACVTVIFACCINHRSVGEPCPRNRRNSKASRLETLVQPDLGSSIRGTSKLPSHQLGCQSQSFVHTCICRWYYLVGFCCRRLAQIEK